VDTSAAAAVIWKSTRSLGRVGTLWVGCGVALFLHGLVLSLPQWRERPISELARLQSRDNTPELLQFTSQAAQTGLGKGVTTPGSPQLPPPKQGEALPVSAPTREFGPSKKGRATRLQPRNPSSAASFALGGDGRPSSVTDSQRWPASRDRREDGKASKSDHQFVNGVSSDWRTAMERLHAIGRESLSSREGAKGSEGSTPTASLAMAEDKGVIRLDANSSLGLAYQSLWKDATPQRILSLEESGRPISTVEVRQVSWRNVRVAELPIRHGQILIVADKTFLFWLHNDLLYFLQDSPSAQSRG
jgi:hypothetical protein